MSMTDKELIEDDPRPNQEQAIEAIPPAYSEFLARQVLSLLPARAGLAATLTRDGRATPTPSTTAQADNEKLSHRPEENL